jgi:hypothetical protein
MWKRWRRGKMTMEMGLFVIVLFFGLRVVKQITGDFNVARPALDNVQIMMKIVRDRKTNIPRDGAVLKVFLKTNSQIARMESIHLSANQQIMIREYFYLFSAISVFQDSPVFLITNHINQ